MTRSHNKDRKVVIISNFHEDNSISRSNMVYKYFTYRNFDTKVLYSNFSHSLKKFRYFDNKDFKHLTTKSYQSSLSINRILSHLIYSLKVIKYLIREKVHIVYVIIPPNWLLLTLLLKLNRKIKFIIDVIDLWPEAFPHDNNIFKKSILSIIGIIPKVSRLIAVQKSDFFITESQYFFKKLKLNGKKNSKVVFIKKIQSEIPVIKSLSEEISIAYLGNIGFIYDFDSLFEIMLGIQKKRRVTLHIIGSGPNRNWFFNQLKNKNLEFIDHGISFDEDFKINKLSKCWFGFNGYKNSTEVALSYKSIDYLSYGVPLLNSAKEDTENLVSSEKIGFNFRENSLEPLITKLSNISQDEVFKMKNRAFITFQNKFSGKSFYDEMDIIINTLDH